MKTKLRGIALVLMLLLVTHSAGAATASRDPSTDAYLAGYITALLEQQLGWSRGSYELEVIGGRAIIRLPFGDTGRLAEALENIRNVEGLEALDVELLDEGERVKGAPETFRESAYQTLGLTGGMVPFPAGDPFRPLLADPKQPQFFVSLRRYDTAVDKLTIGAVGYGENFGLYRRQGARPGDGLQVGVGGALFAQFDMNAPSTDLINADYTIGLPITYRKGDWSGRLRIYHQSSHLGDEYLLRVEPERVNLSFESLEFLASHDWQRWRVYGGGELLLRREPEDLKRGGLHGGLEYHGKTMIAGFGRLVGGLDIKSWHQNDWNADTSLKFGVEFGRPDPGGRRFRIMAEGYKGHAPHGQFYDEKIAYGGIGLYLGF